MTRIFEVETPEEYHEQFLDSLNQGGLINDFELDAERQIAGLSTMHIRRKHYLSEDERLDQLSAELMNRPYLSKRKGKIEVYADGNLVKCQTPLVRPSSRKWSAEKRGNITGFSRQSRLRMMRKVSKLQKAKKPIFVTLTYPDEFSDNFDGKKIKEVQLKNFWKRFIYTYPKTACIWKLEYEERKSGKHIGKLFPHLHLLVWGLCDEDLFEIRDFVSQAWWEVCGQLSENHLKAGTRVERIRSHNGTMFYISKYMSKEATGDLEVGRWWGVKGRKNLPQAKKIVIDFLKKEHYQRAIKFMVLYAGLPEGHWNSLEVFIDGRKFLQHLDNIVFKDGEGAEND